MGCSLTWRGETSVIGYLHWKEGKSLETQRSRCQYALSSTSSLTKYIHRLSPTNGQHSNPMALHIYFPGKKEPPVAERPFPSYLDFVHGPRPGITQKKGVFNKTV